MGRFAAGERVRPGGPDAPYGALGNALVAPIGRWDSVWYLAIADGGYPAADARRPAFFPLYPWLVRAAGAITGSPLIAGALLSTACFAGALVVLHRLTALELGPEAARWTVWALALFPMSFFLSAVYTESLFLLLSVGAVYAARTGRWAWAGVLGGLAAAHAQRRARARRGARPAVAPAARPARRAARVARAGPAPRRRRSARCWRSAAPTRWRRSTRRRCGSARSPGPFAGLWDGAVAAVDGVRQLLHGPAPPVYFAPAGGDPLRVARLNLMLFAFALLAIPALVGALRRLRPAYGAYALAALALPLSYPVAPQPLMSLPRFELVLFPLFMWAGWWLARGGRARRAAVLGAGGALLMAFSAQFATWHWVA